MSYDLTYVMQRRDFVALTFALSPLTPARLIRLALLMVVAIVGGYAAGAGSAAAADLQQPAILEVLVGMAVAAFILVAFPLRWAWLWLAASLLFRRNAAAGKTMTFRIGDAAVTGGMPGVSTTVAWPEVERLIETPRHLFIAISRREAMIVPRRALADDVAFAAFLAYARDRFAASRSVDPAATSA